MSLAIDCNRRGRAEKARRTRTATHSSKFEYVNSKADEFLKRAQPVVSVDTKKKELVGHFKSAGRAALYHVTLDPIVRRITIRGGHRIP